MGPRKVLTRIVIWWSAFTAATGPAWNFTSLLVARFLFGVGEAGAFPNTSRSFAKWFPRRRAGRRARLGVHGHAHGRRDHAADSWSPLMTAIGWRQTFFVFGVLGVCGRCSGGDGSGTSRRNIRQ